jgi:hypothetical protein
LLARKGIDDAVTRALTPNKSSGTSSEDLAAAVAAGVSTVLKGLGIGKPQQPKAKAQTTPKSEKATGQTVEDDPLI